MRLHLQGRTQRNLTTRRTWGGLFVLVLLTLPLLTPYSTLATPSLAPPVIQARAAILVDYNTGRILYAKLPHDIVAMASTTKITSAIVALENGNLDDIVTTSEDDLVGESSMGLVVGEQQTLRNLLYGMLMSSGNDAAMAVAAYVGGKTNQPADEKDPRKRFVYLMNQEAQKLGMKDTHYSNPHGLDDAQHTSSAYDLATIAWYALHNPTFAQIVSTTSYSVPGHYLLNTNELLTRYPGADGVKTGLTDNAGLCLVGSASRNGQRMITVVLNSPVWYDDTKVMMDFGFDTAAAIANGQAPTADQQEFLAIAQRAQTSWDLANALPTQPAPSVTPLLVPATLTPLVQGGPGMPGGASQPLAHNGNNPPAAISTPNKPAGFDLVWLLTIAAFALLILLFASRFGFNFVFGGKTARRQFIPPLVAAPPLQGGGNRFWATSAPPREVRQTQVVELSSRREIEPLSAILNAPVMITAAEDEDALRDHAWRAVEYAYAERHGSALAEFMVVVKANPRYEFDSLPGFYEMPAIGYLALARAYSGVGKRRYAFALLSIAVQRYPGDLNIRKMRQRIQSELGEGK